MNNRNITGLVNITSDNIRNFQDIESNKYYYLNNNTKIDLEDYFIKTEDRNNVINPINLPNDEEEVASIKAIKDYVATRVGTNYNYTDNYYKTINNKSEIINNDEYIYNKIIKNNLINNNNFNLENIDLYIKKVINNQIKKFNNEIINNETYNLKIIKKFYDEYINNNNYIIENHDFYNLKKIINNNRYFRNYIINNIENYNINKFITNHYKEIFNNNVIYNNILNSNINKFITNNYKQYYNNNVIYNNDLNSNINKFITNNYKQYYNNNIFYNSNLNSNINKSYYYNQKKLYVYDVNNNDHFYYNKFKGGKINNPLQIYSNDFLALELKRKTTSGGVGISFINSNNEEYKIGATYNNNFFISKTLNNNDNIIFEIDNNGTFLQDINLTTNKKLKFSNTVADKIDLYNNVYKIGIDGFTFRFNTDEYFKFYFDIQTTSSLYFKKLNSTQSEIYLNGNLIVDGINILDNFNNYYTQTEINNLFNDYYTETEINNLFNNYYDQNEINNLFNTYYNFVYNNYYTKIDSDNKYLLNTDDTFNGILKFNPYNVGFSSFNHQINKSYFVVSSGVFANSMTFENSGGGLQDELYFNLQHIGDTNNNTHNYYINFYKNTNFFNTTTHYSSINANNNILYNLKEINNVGNSSFLGSSISFYNYWGSYIARFHNKHPTINATYTEISGILQVNELETLENIKLANNKYISFGSSVSDKIYLWGTAYKIGIASAMFYFDSGGDYRFFYNSNERLRIINSSSHTRLHFERPFEGSGITWAYNGASIFSESDFLRLNHAGGIGLLRAGYLALEVEGSGYNPRVIVYHDLEVNGTINPFTGAHTVISEINLDDKIGCLLEIESTEIQDINNNKVVAKLNETYKSKLIYGVLSTIRYKKNTETNFYDGYYHYLVNGVGEGAIICSNKNGNIEAGDYLISDGEGYACKQEDDIYRSSTVAKALNSVNFEEENITTKMISCIYLCS
jgi:hypothetical protein